LLLCLLQNLSNLVAQSETLTAAPNLLLVIDASGYASLGDWQHHLLELPRQLAWLLQALLQVLLGTLLFLLLAPEQKLGAAH
jgi:hypothetical protein